MTNANNQHAATDATLRQIFKMMDAHQAQEIREAYYKAIEGLMTLAETLEIAGKGFQPVAWRDPQIGEQIGRVKLAESQESSFLNISRQLFRPTSIPDVFGFLA